VIDQISIEQVRPRISLVRGQKVLLDFDLAKLYGVETRVLIQAVTRNLSRFPIDFAFKLEQSEWESLRSQFVISKIGRGGRRWLPYAFTEQGVAMLASVLRSPQAIAVNIEIVRIFVRLRQFTASEQYLAEKLLELERRIESQDAQIAEVFAAIRDLMHHPDPPHRPIGFIV
jgi:hypothetical protein